MRRCNEAGVKVTHMNFFNISTMIISYHASRVGLTLIIEHSVQPTYSSGNPA